MLGKYIVMFVVGVGLGTAGLLCTQSTPDTHVSNGVSRIEPSSSIDGLEATGRIAALVQNADLPRRDKQSIAERIRHVMAKLDQKIKQNREPLMRETLTGALDVLERTTQALDQKKITPVEAKEIAAITVAGVAKQAKRCKELRSAFAKEFAKKLEGHEDEFMRGVMQGINSVQQNK